MNRTTTLYRDPYGCFVLPEWRWLKRLANYKMVNLHRVCDSWPPRLWLAKFGIPIKAIPMNVARIYLRVSTDQQDLTRQSDIERNARAAGYYIAGVYREKASGARADRPELLRMISDLQPGDVVIVERIDRISRLPLPEAEKLVASIRSKGAKLAVAGLVDLSDVMSATDGVARVVLEAVQDLLLRLALQMARDDYETRRERQRQGIDLAKVRGKYVGRKANIAVHQRIIALRKAGQTIALTAEIAGCSLSQVKRIWAIYRSEK